MLGRAILPSSRTAPKTALARPSLRGARRLGGLGPRRRAGEATTAGDAATGGTGDATGAGIAEGSGAPEGAMATDPSGLPPSSP